MELAQDEDQGGAHADETAPHAADSGNGPASARQWVRRLDVATVVLLSVSSLFTAWAGHQSGLWNAESANFVSQAETRQVEATRLTTIGYQIMQIDVALFLEWLRANQENDAALAAFYEDRFTAHLKSAFEAWMATDPFTEPAAPSDPFRMPEYRLPQIEAAAAADAEAATAFADADFAGAIAEAYMLATILMAIALFFGGISAKLAWMPAQITMLAIATFLLLFTVFKLGGLPDGSTWGLTPLWG
jgi:hypothetical protein